MENRYFTIRVIKKVKDVYKKVKYNKSHLIEAFRRKYKDQYSEFINKYEQVNKLPPALVGGKESITAPVNIKDRDEFKAFIGYILTVLRQTKGDEKQAIQYIRKDLGV